MIAELGHLALVMAFCLSFATVGTALFGLRSKPLFQLMPVFAFLHILLITGAFGALIYSYAISDFSVLTVVLNSHSAKPLLYKITGAWGNHEGSMLLWAWVLAAYGLLVALKHSSSRELQHYTLAVHALVAAGFLAFILFTSNPFVRVFPPAPEGQDLNPLLQDIGLALHPPLLYLGYVGFGIIFSYAIAAMWLRRIDSAWAREVQPFALLAWSALTLGIAMGSWWAYRELGWGGWWFWDPVENVSLLPWFAGTALLHSNLVLERRNMLGGWVLLLAVTCFAMSLIGTFLVRSGLVMSVHAFASDPLRGNAILVYIACVVGSALLLYAFRRTASPSQPIALFSRVGLILMNNVLLLVIAGTILLSIIAPMVLTLLKLPSFTVGAPYFNTVFFPLAAPLVLLAGIAPLVPWQSIGRDEWWKRIAPLMMFSGAAVMFVFMIAERGILLGMIAAAFTGWLLSATCWQAIRRYRAIPANEGESTLHRLRRFPLQQAGTLTAHMGIAVLTAAIAWSSLGRDQYEAILPPTGILEFGAYRLVASDATMSKQDNFVVHRAPFTLSRDGKELTLLTPEIRYYPARDMETSEVALDSGILRDIYLVIGRSDVGSGTRGIGVRLYVTPGMMLLWSGFALVALGGGLSLVARLRAPSREALS